MTVSTTGLERANNPICASGFFVSRPIPATVNNSVNPIAVSKAGFVVPL